MKNNILIILRGTGQVMLQNNALTGIIFLMGIFYNSWQLGVAAIIGNIISTVSAVLFKYPGSEIEDGIYGFNGTLVGIAICFFFGFNSIAIFAIIPGAIVSTLLMRALSGVIPAFTAPFIISTWLILFGFIFFSHIPFATPASPNYSHYNFLPAVCMGFGQVMLQGNIVTGILFFIAIAVNSRIAAFYSLYGSLLGSLLAVLLSLPVSMISTGIFGYNAVLCAIALGGKKPVTFLPATIGIILSVLINFWMGKAGIITLTAPFVLSTWIILFMKSNNLFIKKTTPQANEME